MESAASKELLEVYVAAKKAADDAEKTGSPADVNRCVEALQNLRELPVTVSILVHTQVGKKLKTHLAKHSINKIQRAASDICDLWKKKVIEESSRKTSEKRSEVKSEQSGGFTRSESLKSDKSNSSSMERLKVENSPKSGSALTAERKGHGEPSDVRVKAEKKAISSDNEPSYGTSGQPKLSSLVKCNDPIRDKARELFAEALSKVSKEADEDLRDEVAACDPIRVAVMLESVLFGKIGRSNGTQKQKYRSILFNLKDQNNPDFRRRVLLGQVKPEDVINLSAEDMASDERKAQNKQIKDKALFECERGQAPKASTDQFKCGRCGQRKCTYYQMQTRSADEPMTTYVTCVNCNNHWKFC